MSRSAHEAVIGCSNEGGSRDVFGKDVCVPTSTPPTAPTPTVTSPTFNYLDSLQFNDKGCSSNSPCSKCNGPCYGNNSICDSGLTCFVRSGSESIPGCVTGGSGDVSGIDYCHEDPTDGTPTYIPGDLTKRENGIILSTGLTSTIIARTGIPVSYVNDGQSNRNFHGDPDAGAVFEDINGTNPGGYV